MNNVEIESWLRLSLEPDLKHHQRLALLKAFGLPENIFDASIESLASYIERPLASAIKSQPAAKVQALIDKTMLWLQQKDNHLISLADKNYPKSLLSLTDPPIIIYATGQIETLKRHKIALVGARSATYQGIENAHAFGSFLATKGWCIVSGLASGIDAAAHEGALKSAPSLSTIAVLGTGADLVYPPNNKQLAKKIAANGLLITEFPLGTPAFKYNFPKRNRIVAALTLGVVVVEATTHSGSLITARIAGELGKEVYAIPGSIHSPLARGCHQLIRQGAKLVESGQDIIEELSQMNLPMPELITSTDTTNQVKANIAAKSLDQHGQELLNAIGYEASSLEAIQARTKWDLNKLMQQLTLLELKGIIIKYPNGQYIRSN